MKTTKDKYGHILQTTQSDVTIDLPRFVKIDYTNSNKDYLDFIDFPFTNKYIMNFNEKFLSHCFHIYPSNSPSKHSSLDLSFSELMIQNTNCFNFVFKLFSCQKKFGKNFHYFFFLS